MFNEACAPPSESAVDRQIVFPLSHSLQTNGERNGQPLLHDFTDDIQFMDIEETGGTARTHTFSSSHVLHCSNERNSLCSPESLFMYFYT